MGERVKVGTERMLPSLNFKLKFLINIPVSAEEKLNMNFATYCGNNDETRSQKLRGIIFDEVGATNQKEFDKIFIEESNYVKDKIKEKIKERNKYKVNKDHQKNITKQNFLNEHKLSPIIPKVIKITITD